MELTDRYNYSAIQFEQRLKKKEIAQTFFSLIQTRATFNFLIIGILILFFISTLSFAQSATKIHGYVTDSESGTPLVGANILIEGTGIGTNTDTEGYFQFNNLLVGSYTISASYIGYKKEVYDDIKVTLDFSTELDINLTPKTYLLNQVVVSSKDEKQNYAGNVNVYNRNKIDKKQSQTVGEILEEIPGVEVQSTGAVGNSQTVSIRGSQANQVLILLDGIPLNNHSGGEADLSTIPVNIIEKIEVYEGGSSSKFGSGAIGGAINIITRNQFNNETKLNSSIGSYGLKQIEPVISGSFNNLNYFFSYNYLESKGNYDYDFIDNAGENQTATKLNSEFKSNNIFAKINYQFGKNTISLNWQTLNSTRGIPGKVHALSPYANAENTNNIWGLTYHINNDRFSLTGDLKYSSTSTENENKYPDDAPLKYRKAQIYHYEYEVDNYLLNITSIYKVADWLILTSGYSLKKLEYSDRNYIATVSSPTTAANDLSHGFYLHQEWKKEFDWLKSKIVFTPAIRYDHIELESDEIERNESKWSPGASIYLSIGEENRLFVKSNYSKSFRVPTFADLFYQEVRVQGKADLLPEKGTNRDFSIGFNLKLWGILNAKFTTYKNKIDDLIVWRLGSYEIFRPFNTDAELTGKEYIVGYSFPNDLFVLSYSETNLDPLNKNDNETTYNKIIPYKPVSTKNAKIEFNYKDFNASINYKYTGKRYVTAANTIEMPPYKVWNFNTSWLVNVAPVKLKLKLSVLNLLEEKYEIIRDYPLPAREWRIGLSIIY